MNMNLPLPLYYSWPLFEAAERLDLPAIRPFSFGSAPSPLGVVPIAGVLAAQGIGVWECDLADNRLTWTQGVYDLFGLPNGVAVERSLTVSLYHPESRIAMEQLRAHAIRHRRGFTIDVAIRRPDGEDRWMALSAVPIIENRKVERLCGLKVDVTERYDGAAVRQAWS
jgi:PAS domain S-box-containing protein